MKALIACCLICLPLRSLKLTSPYGERLHPVTGKYAFHQGIDLRAKSDTVFAVVSGVTLASGYSQHLGIYILLGHKACQSEYGHLSQVFVRAGDSVRCGDPIGITGATGRVTGEHLHFNILFNSQYINPLKFLYQLLIQQDHE